MAPHLSGANIAVILIYLTLIAIPIAALLLAMRKRMPDGQPRRFMSALKWPAMIIAFYLFFYWLIGVPPFLSGFG